METRPFWAPVEREDEMKKEEPAKEAMKIVKESQRWMNTGNVEKISDIEIVMNLKKKKACVDKEMKGKEKRRRGTKNRVRGRKKTSRGNKKRR